MSENGNYRGLDGFLKLLDLSKWPQRNDRVKKLGNFLQTFVATVIVEEAGAAKTADGQTIEDTLLSHWPMEPDIVNLRIHDPEGTDNVYDFGLILDHDSVSSSDDDRTTIIKDGETVQTYALPTDLMRVSQKLAPVAGQAMNLTAAGFPSILSPTRLGRGTGTRGAISLNISRNQGFTDDGKDIGQLSHLLTYPAAGGGGGTQAGGKKKSGEKELVLRADAKIRFGAKLGRFMDEPDGKAVLGADSDERRLVLLFVDTPAPPDDKLDTEENGKSNHEKIPKNAPCRVIHGVVRVPKAVTPSPYPSESHHSDYSYHGPPPGRTGDSSMSASASGGAKLPTITDSDPLGTPPKDMGGPSSVDTGVTRVRASDGVTERKITTEGGNTIWIADVPLPPADLSQQAQQGHLEAQSPEFSQRSNSHEFSDRDAVGVMNDVKPPTFTTIHVRLNVKVSGYIAPGDGINFEVMLSARNEAGAGPVYFYGYQFAVDKNFFSVNHWATIDIYFKGFGTQRQFIEVFNARLAGEGYDAPSTRAFHVSLTSLFWEDASAAPPDFGYGTDYGNKYGYDSY